MKLTVSKRAKAKSEAKKIRREGNIPAILYSQGKEGVTLSVPAGDFRKILNQIVPNTLSTTIFELQGEGKAHKAILRDVQYHVTSYEPIHLDFQELIESKAVTLNVPLICTGVVDCIGVKLGGVLRQIVRSIEVSCLPKDIPSHFEIDIKELNVGESKDLSEIKFPKGVKPLVELTNVAVSIGKK